MKAKLIIISFLSLVISGCGVFGNHANKSRIVGQWHWLVTTGGFAGITETPDSTGYPTVVISFSTSYRYTLTRNDTLIYSGSYSINKDGLLSLHVPSSNNFFPDKQITFNGKDTLVLMDNCYDCYISTYKRLN